MLDQTIRAQQLVARSERNWLMLRMSDLAAAEDAGLLACAVLLAVSRLQATAKGTLKLPNTRTLWVVSQ